MKTQELKDFSSEELSAELLNRRKPMIILTYNPQTTDEKILSGENLIGKSNSFYEVGVAGMTTDEAICVLIDCITALRKH